MDRTRTGATDIALTAHHADGGTTLVSFDAGWTTSPPAALNPVLLRTGGAGGVYRQRACGRQAAARRSPSTATSPVASACTARSRSVETSRIRRSANTRPAGATYGVKLTAPGRRQVVGERLAG
ncbi:hypothetical protein [Streptomyces virginiae]|uniref:hypothetical protein n=1 Tax=Streptomyces virginiae TaxID=1961 RepID=UPI003682427B